MMLAGWDSFKSNNANINYGIGPNIRYNSTMPIPLPSVMGVQMHISGLCVGYLFLVCFTTCCSHRELPYKRKAYSFEPPPPEPEPDYNERQDSMPVITHETRSKLAAMWNRMAKEKAARSVTREDKLREDIEQRLARLTGKPIATKELIMSPPTKRAVNSNVTILPSLDTFFQTKKRGPPIFPSSDGPSDMQQEAQEFY
jgi:hypothetical protein